MRNKIFLILFLSNLCFLKLKAQDPHFSQFFVASQFVNPALAGSGIQNWKVSCNWRQQWGNASTPFNTQAFSGEYKITGQTHNGSDDSKTGTMAVGGTLLMDQSMYGAFKSTYGVGTFAYHKPLSYGDEYMESIAIGLHALYGNRTIDYSRLTFGEQFTSGGFDVTLPTGETALNSLKPFVSLGAGLLYNYRDKEKGFKIGGAVFNLNRPKQSFLNDPLQLLPIRYVAHANAEFKTSETTILSFNGIYQSQALPSYFAIGGSIGKDLSGGDQKTILYLGGWFREGDSFYPYIGWLQGKVQMGLTYDITASKQNDGPSIPRSFEFSLIITKENMGNVGIPCPTF